MLFGNDEFKLTVFIVKAPGRKVEECKLVSTRLIVSVTLEHNNARSLSDASFLSILTALIRTASFRFCIDDSFGYGQDDDESDTELFGERVAGESDGYRAGARFVENLVSLYQSEFVENRPRCGGGPAHRL